MGPCSGDTAVALFPETDEASGARGLYAALDLSREVQKWSEARKKKTGLAVDVGMGLDMGPVFGGPLAGRNGLGPTYLGEAIAGAARLERLGKVYGINIALSEAIYRDIGTGAPEIREVDTVQAPGLSRELTFYDAFATDPETRRNAKERNTEDFERALHLYRNRAFTEAAGIFSLLHKKMPFDAATTLLLRRCLAFQKMPPPDSWVGVTVLPGR